MTKDRAIEILAAFTLVTINNYFKQPKKGYIPRNESIKYFGLS